MSEIISINFEETNNNDNNGASIRLDKNSLFNNAPKATQLKAMGVRGFLGGNPGSIFDQQGHDATQYSAEQYQEMMVGCDIAYTGEKRSIYLADGTIVPDNFAIVKSDDEHQILGVVGNQYNAVGNIEAFSVAEEIAKEGLARYELAGPCIGAKDKLDYSRSMLVMRGDDFDIAGDNYESFILFTNSFDGSSGIKFQSLVQRLVCLNGMVRYLGGKKRQLQINIQHTKSAVDRIKQAHEIMVSHQQQVKMLQKEAEAFINTPLSKEEYQNKIIPLVLKSMKLVEKDKERERGAERIEKTVAALNQHYNRSDAQNFMGTAWAALLALSSYESHEAPLRNTGNKSIYLNRITKGMVLSSAVAEYIADQNGIRIV